MGRELPGRYMSEWSKIIRGYEKVCAIIRAADNAREGYHQLVDQLSQLVQTELWSAFRVIDIERDVALVREWLIREIETPGPDKMTGLYLGLDTLNMREGNGYNLEIGGSSDADRSDTSFDWVYHCRWRGNRHLLRGLYEMYTSYNPIENYDLSQFLEMPLWVGYSGLVIADALIAPDGKALLGKADCRTVVWGHHDGDLFALGHLTANGLQRTCESF